MCEICGASFTRTKYLRKHAKVHKAGKIIKCPLCKLYFNTSVQLEKHIKRHNQKNGRKARIKVQASSVYCCDNCNRKFLRLGNLKMHERKCKIVDKGETSEKINIDLIKVEPGEVNLNLIDFDMNVQNNESCGT